MRCAVQVAVAALALGLAAAPAAGQDDATPNPPKAPIPYTQLVHKKAPPKPHATAASKPAATTSAAAKPGAPATAPNAPAVAGALPVVAAGSATLGAGQPLPPAQLETFVDGYVHDAMARDHIAGVAVSIVQNGQVVLKKGYGFASLSPVRPVDPDRTLFRIGSISKTFTWIALMKEVEGGRIRLDQPVNLYLPEKVQVRDQGYADTPVRVANLMDHSAGFEDRMFGQLVERDPNRVRPLQDYLRQERPKRVRAPGEASSYSNYGAALAGEAVSWTSGKPYEQLVEQEIFEPLGMKRTSFREPHPERPGLPAPLPAPLAAELADGFAWTGVGYRREPFEYLEQVAPAASASSTAADMARYMALLLGNGSVGGVTVYGPRTAEAFRTPLRKTPEGVNGWAHGFLVHEAPGGRLAYGHDGGTLSFSSNLLVIPSLNLGVFITTNTDTGPALVYPFVDAVVREFYGPKPAAPRPGSPDLAQDASAFAGRYLTTRRAYSGLEGFVGLLRGGASVGVTGQGRLTTDVDGKLKTWVPAGALQDGLFVSTNGDEHLAFQMDGGRAGAFIPAGGASLYERVSTWKNPRTLEILAGLAAFASLGALAGLALRNRRDTRENVIQARASLVQNIQAGLWIVAFALFAVWAIEIAPDRAEVMFGWPGPWLILASACALVAAILTILTIAALPAVWRGGRRVDSWSPLRKLFFTFTVLIYAGFSVVLGMWGALSPWGG